MSPRSFLACLGLAFGSCGGGEAPEDRVAFALPAFELRPVVGPALAALEAELSPSPAPPPADPDHVRGLVGLVAGSDASMREIALEEAAAEGDSFAPGLLALVEDESVDATQRQAAVELLGRLDTWRAADHLALLVETASEPWLRAHAAWRLGSTTQDWVVPRLYLRLKYEADHDTVIWLARTLAHFGNYSGLSVLGVVASSSPDENLRASAAARMGEAVAEAGFEDVEELWRAWSNAAEVPAFRPQRSKRFDLELWRRVERLREFQLRGVDDSRFVFEGLGAHTAELLASALYDENVYVRVHCAQGLQRMGARGTPAGDELIAALGEGELGPHAATALGAIGYPAAVAALVHCLDPGASPDLRLASARALGRFAPEDAAAALDPLRGLLSEGEPLELRQAAAESLAYLGEGDEVAQRLRSYLTTPALEPVTSEHALRHWLAQRAAEDERAAEALLRWDELVIPNDAIVPREEKQASRAARAELVDALLVP